MSNRNFFKLILVLGSIILLMAITSQQSAKVVVIKLEIYTPIDTYYINDLIVTTKGSNIIHKFDNIDALYKYISDQTAFDVNLREEEYKLLNK